MFSPLDDYGIKIFRDKLNAKKLEFNRTNASVYVYEQLDSRKIRAFIASILWRLSISQQNEFINTSIGPKYRRKIKYDLLNPVAKFTYIDAVTCFLTDEFHQGIILPYKRKIQPRDLQRDKMAVNGWVIGLPHIVIVTSLDTKRHPSRGYYELGPDLTKVNSSMTVSTSLLEKRNGYAYMILEQEKSAEIEEAIYGIFDSNIRLRKE